MRFEVPQFIEIEDKIVGPLSWKQFVYVAGGVGVLIILFLTLPFLFFIILGFPVAGLAVSLAFHKVNNRPFSIFLESFLSYLINAKLYLWKRETMQSIIEREEHSTPTAPDLTPTHQKSIGALSHKLELHPPE